MTAVVTVNVSNDDGDTKEKSPASTTEGKTSEDASGEASGDIEIEIEITTLEGDDLAENMSVTSSRGGAEITVSADGDIGVSTDGVFFADNTEIQMGETLTFTVPSEIGEAQGATITISNLVDEKTGAESALVIAYDSEGKEVLRCVVDGNKSGDVTVDIDVSFSKIDFRPVDNGSWTLSDNSDFTIERIDIKTGGPLNSDGAQHSRGNLLDGFQGFFNLKNFSLQRSVQRQERLSTTQIFSARQSATNHQQADETSQKEIDLREQATTRAAKE